MKGYTMSIFKNYRKDDTDLNTDKARTATAGYDKLRQGGRNILIDIALYIRDAGLWLYDRLGEVKSGKQTAVNHVGRRVDTFKEDLKGLKKQLKKAKGKTTKADIQETIVICKRNLVYYEKKLSNAITL